MAGAPLGSDDFVESRLGLKQELFSTVSLVGRIPYKHEPASLLRSCVSECKVVHLARTLPPRQSAPILREIDKILRSGFESILEAKLSERWRL